MMIHKVIVEKQCGCFKKSGEAPIREFDNKDDALIGANAWKDEMNETFCDKHRFDVVESGDDLVITVGMRG